MGWKGRSGGLRRGEGRGCVVSRSLRPINEKGVARSKKLYDPETNSQSRRMVLKREEGGIHM